MGCCLTTTHGGRNSQIESESLKINKSTPSQNSAPPSIEEETVKEVLSETPKLIKPELHHHHHHDDDDGEEEDKQKKNIHIDPVPFPDEDTVNSEVCSLSISETVSTTTFDYGYNDDEGEVKQRVKRSPAKLPVKNRSLSGDFGCRREWVTGKSPNRRTDQSPDKRNNVSRGGCGSVKPGQSRESSSVGRRVLRPDPYRRDSGEGSGRRSRSPAANRSSSTTGRSLSARRRNGSPGRVRTDVPDKWPSTSNMGTSTTPNESLENPLVSLECFIFL
ncbi:uncharacterized protein [Euphorbia lathyris]|uniref:uncharacterized protein n=1 Tax=Euphorbia lathyris TaxID=212925 RepID=UPI00331444DA